MRFAPFAALLLSITAAAAQTPGGYSDAQRNSDQTLSQNYLRAVLAPAVSLENQYSRWRMPVCVQIQGLTPLVAHEIQQHIRAVAQKAGATLDRQDPCIANVVIVFTADPGQALTTLTKGAPIRTRSGDGKPVTMQPIQAWYATFVRDHGGARTTETAMGDGVLIAGPQGIGVQAGERDPRDVDAGLARANMTRLRTGVTSELANAIILVNTAVVGEMPVASLGDYLAMLALAQVRTGGDCKQIASVTNLFAAGCSAQTLAETMTGSDTAMLAALYKTPLEPERLQHQRILGSMREGLEELATK